MVAALLPVLVAAVGAAVAFAALRRHGWDAATSGAVAVAMAPGVGFGLASLSFFFWVFAGFGPPGRWTLIGLAGALAMLLLAPVTGRVDPVAAPAARRRPRAALLLLLLLVAVCLGLLLWTLPSASAAQPFGGWDAWAIWNVRSLQLYRATPGDIGRVIGELKYGHPDYPLMLPSSLAAQYCLLGREDVAIPQVTGLLFGLGAGAAMFVAVWRLGSAAGGAAAVAVLWSTPAFWRWVFAQYADIPLGYLLVVTAAALASQLEADARYRLPAVVAGFCFGLLAWTKNEGLVLAGLLAVAFVGVLTVVVRPLAAAFAMLRRLPWLAAGALPALTALVLFKSYWSPINETARFVSGASDKLIDPDRWRPVITAFWEQLNPWTGLTIWGLLWPFVAVCGVVIWRRRSAAGAPATFLGVAVALIWATWVVVYVCTPAEQVWHLNSSLRRLLLQITPLTLAWSLAGAGRDAPPRGADLQPDEERA